MPGKYVILVMSATLLVVPPSSSAAVHQAKHRRIKIVKTLSVHELILVDQKGTPRIRLSAAPAQPSLQMLGPDGSIALSMTLDDAGLPSIALDNSKGGTTASLAVDPKGAHIKFDHPSGASSYLFLNDQGISGVVLVDKFGKRRYQVLLNSDGTVKTGRIDDAGNLIP